MEATKKLILDFLLPHAFEFYRTADSKTTDGDKLRRLASWIVTSGVETITTRDLTRNVRDMRGMDVRQIQTRMSPLIAGGWAEPEKPGPENTRWRVNTAVVQWQFEEQKREEERRKTALAKLIGGPRKASGS